MASIDIPLIEVIGNETLHNNSKHVQQTIQKEPGNDSENTSILLSSELDRKGDCFARLKSKFRRQSCLKSKPVILILIWSFLSCLHATLDFLQIQLL